MSSLLLVITIEWLLIARGKLGNFVSESPITSSDDEPEYPPEMTIVGWPEIYKKLRLFHSIKFKRFLS